MDRVPANPLEFIRTCVRLRAVYWTYHVNLRLRKRSIDRRDFLGAVDTFEFIESYPDEKYLPSFLVYFLAHGQAHHAVVAVDTENSNVRIVTVYKPDSCQWSSDMRRRIGS